MTYEIPDAWKLDSGLRDDLDFDITMAYFKTSQDYQGGRVYQLWLTGTDQDDEVVEMRLSIGADWTSADGGATVQHATKTKINKSTIYGHWINAAIELDDVVDGQTLRDVIFGRGTPTQANIWEGLRIHCDLKTISFGKNVDPQDRLLPTRFLGLSTDTPAATIPPTPPVAPPAPPVAPAAPPVQPATPPATVPTAPVALTPQQLVAQAQAAAAVPAPTGSPLFQEMVNLARASSTHGEFMAQAWTRPEVLADEELAMQVADEAQIWALAKA